MRPPLLPLCLSERKKIRSTNSHEATRKRFVLSRVGSWIVPRYRVMVPPSLSCRLVLTGRAGATTPSGLHSTVLICVSGENLRLILIGKRGQASFLTAIILRSPIVTPAQLKTAQQLHVASDSD